MLHFLCMLTASRLFLLFECPPPMSLCLIRVRKLHIIIFEKGLAVKLCGLDLIACFLLLVSLLGCGVSMSVSMITLLERCGHYRGAVFFAVCCFGLYKQNFKIRTIKPREGVVCGWRTTRSAKVVFESRREDQ